MGSRIYLWKRSAVQLVAGEENLVLRAAEIDFFQLRFLRDEDGGGESLIAFAQCGRNHDGFFAGGEDGFIALYFHLVITRFSSALPTEKVSRRVNS